MDEKVQTLADLLHADPSKITYNGLNVYIYGTKYYWVATDAEKGAGGGKNWQWIGQLGNIHVFRKR